jgi:MYXO-CTERM domain-containing protein
LRRLLLLLPLAACNQPGPFDARAWGATCSVAPLPLQVTFPGTQRVDESGSERSYLAHVDVALDASGLADVYVWQVQVDDRGNAQTEWMERAPIPDDLVAAFDLQPLDLDPTSFTSGTDNAEMSGHCAWGDTEGDLAMNATWCSGICFDCATGGDPRQLSVALTAMGALALRRRRHRP